jgi:hypothetical protein
MRASIVGIVVLLAATAGCGRKDDSQKMHEIVEEWSRAFDSTGVLFIDPGECVACNNMISDWMRWGKGGDSRSLVIVFTRGPSAEEAKWLRSARVTADTVMSRDWRRAILDDPILYFSIHGTIVDSAEGQNGLHLLLDRVARSGAT